MQQRGLLDSETDQRALTLQARLVKDRAKRAGGSDRARLFAESAAIYAKAGAIDRSSYPLINAASLSLLAGQAAQSRKLARNVLDALDANPDEAETPYWLGATRAEALLLLGKEQEARAALRAAITKQPAAWEDHAATLGQFELLYTELGYDAGWLDQIRPPSSVQFCGIMNVAQSDDTVESQITEWLERENAGFGYGALAAGADIWIAEALLERDGELHVILPCDAKLFREVSVMAVDPAWGPRFDDLMRRAASVQLLDNSGLPNPAAVERGDMVALGMAAHQAMQLRAHVRQLRIIGDGDASRAADPSSASLIKATRLGQRSSAVADDAVDRLQMLVLTGDAMQCFDTLEEGLAAASNTDMPSAIDWIVGRSGDVSKAAANRLAAMLECAEAGQCLATHAAGFGLLGCGADIRVESAGEMRWAGGQMPLYAIT